MPCARATLATLVFLAGCAPALVVTPGPAASVPEPAARAAAPGRPIPYPVELPPEFRRAVERGTRTTTGRPGPRHWTQWTDYRIRTSIEPGARRVSGTANVVYHNRSPDTLSVLYVHLFQNLHAPGVVRNEAQEVTGGVQLRRVGVAGRALAAGATGVGYTVDGTVMQVRPPSPVPPGATVPLDFEWSFVVPRSGAGRMGWDRDDLVFIAYWYPQMAMYDDVVGWHTDPYLGNAEFYVGHGSYDVRIDAPAGWLVRATGAFRNPEATLEPAVLERFRRAQQSDSVIAIAGAGDLARSRVTRPGTRGRLEWHFQADTARDFAFSVTRRSLWDGARTPVGDRTGDGQTEYAFVDALYRETAPLWANVARYSQHAIAFLSRYLGYPYPWPVMTAVEGGEIIGGGMEFPMITLMGDYNQRGAAALYYVTAHELAHMWMPMIVNTDESRHAWMDEGTTTFNENMARLDHFPGSDPFGEDREVYLRVARAGMEGEIMRWSNFHYPGPAYGVASYMKPGAVLHALRGMMGSERFDAALRDFFAAWAYRNPTPWDLFNHFSAAAGQDLGWFWRSWYFETWTLDQAVASVTSGPGGTTITVEDRGTVPMPVRLAITRADGATERREIPVDVWLGGARSATLTVPAGAGVTRVEIDPEAWFPDIDRTNNVWTR
jgi:hypothetical protein